VDKGLGSTLISGVFNWTNVISALMQREALSRYAGGSLGFAWAFLIPVAWILSLTAFFLFLGRDAPIHADLPSFIATGMLPYLFFRNSVTAMMRIEKAHRHLVHLPSVRVSDLYTAAACLEVLSALTIFGIILGLIGLTFAPVWPGDALGTASAVGLAVALGVSFGRLSAVLALVSDSAARIVPVLLRPFFWISGVFFTASELPGWVADILWYNPLFHLSEMLRGSFFDVYTSSFADPVVPITAIIAFYALSCLLEDWCRSRHESALP
jgi:capsular polysaccharide transport system permease protein